MSGGAPLLIVTGPPGAGKSTVAALVVERFEPSALVEGDAFFGFLRRGAIEPWLPASKTQNETVVEGSAAAAGRFARGGITTVFDGMVGPWFLPTFAAATGLDRLDYVVLLPSVEQCVARVATREGHGFTDEPATRKMHAEFTASAIDPRHVLLDPTGPPEAIAARIASAIAAGTLTYRC
jgi:cytidylate kinase